MQIVEPKIFHIAGTAIDGFGTQDLLDHLGVSDWKTSVDCSSAEQLIELCGRRCYRAFETEGIPVGEQNPNLTRVRTGNKEYIENLLRSHHGAVIEHAYDTYAIEDVSRVFTHEVVRHRLCNFSQESLRFVRPTSLNAYFPDIFKDLPNDVLTEEQLDGDLATVFREGATIKQAVGMLFEQTFRDLEKVQRHLVTILGMDGTSKLFGDKKLLQSAMRRLMPIGMTTAIIVTTNHRNWRHLVQMRTAPGAEEEIRKVFFMIAEDLLQRYPAIYQDMRFNRRPSLYAVTFDYGRA